MPILANEERDGEMERKRGREYSYQYLRYAHWVTITSCFLQVCVRLWCWMSEYYPGGGSLQRICYPDQLKC